MSQASFPPVDQGLNALWAGLLVEECCRQGIDYFVLSPGSRSTPLTVATARRQSVRRVVAYDERGAAFHALGYARATGRPAVLICTSGTAAANYLPAVIEAHMDRVPMLICSADRPPELRDTGANQTIPQPDLFTPYVRWRYDMPCPTDDIAPTMVLTTVAQALHRAQRAPAGPVHLNWMFREPLAPTPALLSADYLAPLAPWQAGNASYTRYAIPQLAPDLADVTALAAILNATQRGVVVLGRLTTAERLAARALAEALGWPVFPDLVSGWRLGALESPFIPYYDQVLLNAAPDPETILHLGGPLLSKRALGWLGRGRARHTLVVGAFPDRYDPTHGVNWRLEAHLTALWPALQPYLRPSGDPAWLDAWRRRSLAVDAALDAYLGGRPDLNEISLARLISRHIHPEASLMVGNSMPIRDMDMYAAAAGPAIWLAANRGASGIDGNIATATGLAAGRQSPLTLVLGDLACLHDLSSLTLLRELPYPVTLVVVNNQGGGIFDFLPVRQATDVFEPYFGTPHDYRFGPIAAAFGLPYVTANDTAEFRAIYQASQASGRHNLIEIRTDRAANWRLHTALQSHIAAILEPFPT